MNYQGLDSKWESWEGWTTCDSDCMRSRSRTCAGDICNGKSKYIYTCTGGDCPDSSGQ